MSCQGIVYLSRGQNVPARQAFAAALASDGNHIPALLGMLAVLDLLPSLADPINDMLPELLLAQRAAFAHGLPRSRRACEKWFEDADEAVLDAAAAIDANDEDVSADGESAGSVRVRRTAKRSAAARAAWTAVTPKSRKTSAGSSSDPAAAVLVEVEFFRGFFLEVAAEKPSAALVHYRTASDRGHALSQFRLGLAYEAGAGTRKDAPKALELFLRAVSGGVGAAVFTVLHLGMVNPACHPNPGELVFGGAVSDATPEQLRVDPSSVEQLAQLSIRLGNVHHLGCAVTITFDVASACPVISRVYAPLQETPELYVLPQPLRLIQARDWTCIIPLHYVDYQDRSAIMAFIWSVV
jgi:hypothetical protein